MFEQASAPAERNVIGYFTGVVGVALLARTVASAALILIFVVGHPADSIFSGILFVALTLFGSNRRKQDA